MRRIVESSEEIKYKNITRNYVLLVLTVIVALALIVAIVGYVLSGGILPNAHKGLSLIIYPTEKQMSSQTSESHHFPWYRRLLLILVRLKVKC